MARREKTVRVPVALPEESRPAAWLRNFRLSGFALSMLGLIVAALLVLAAPLKTLVEQRQQIAQLEASLAEAQDAVDDLNEEVARWDDQAYIEAQARERLYYILPGEVSYLIVGTTTSGGGSDELPDQRRDPDHADRLGRRAARQRLRGRASPTRRPHSSTARSQRRSPAAG